MRLSQLLAIVLLFTCGLSNVRADLYPVSLEQRSAQAPRIAIGTVSGQYAYWIEGQGAVTASTVKVAAWLKGASKEDEVVVLALGGVVGDRATIVMPSLRLEIGQEYVLFLDAEETRLHDRALKQARPALRQSFAYADSQGALPYQMERYREVFGAPLAPTEALERIAALVKERATTPSGQAYSARRINVLPTIQLFPIMSFAPNPTRGGTIDAADFLNIIGSGFGGAAGTVWYTNADDGGATFTTTGVASDNTSWADGAITNKTSDRAATGPINVNGAMTSGSNLTVNWAHLTLNSDFLNFGVTTRQRYYLRNMNGSGGMSFRYSTAGFSANAPAVAAFERAMSSWRCNSIGINFAPGGTTALGYANDNVNVVMFDGTLPAGVLGRATSRFNGGGISGGVCDLHNTVWGLEEVDVQFFTDPPSPGFPWEYGPAAPAFSEYDFQTVAVHELGHAVGLGHRIAAGQTMHFAISNGAQARTPAAMEIQAAQVKLAYSDDATCTNPSTLGTGPMVPVLPAVCDLSVPVADVSITKTDGAASEIPGTTVTYTIVASNASGPASATGVTVTDTFPGSLSGCSTTSVAAGGATGNDAGPTAGNISDGGITLPLGSTVTYTSTCTIAAATTGNLANTASVTATTADGNAANNSATDTDTLAPTADVAITKTDGAANEVPGTSVTYTIVASNPSGPSVATGVTVADTFPAALSGCSTTSVAAGGATGNDAGPTAGTFSDSGITLPVGGTVTYTSTCTIGATATGNLANTATVSTTVTDGNAANNSATDTDALNATADLSITKTDGSASEIPGTTVTYTIVASNSSGPSVATSVTVADTFDAALSGCSTTSVAAGGATGHDAGPTAGNINDSGITLPVGATVTYTSTCTIAAGTTGNLVNTATIATTVTDGNAANNSATDTDTLNAAADVSITKTDGSVSEVPGTTVTYTIVASNSAGPSSATGVTVADTFPGVLSGCSTTSVAAGGATGNDVGPTAGNINDGGITLPVGGTVTYTSTCTIGASATGNLVNNATITTASTDGTPANNSATDTDTLAPAADVSITKTDGSATEIPGTTVIYTIVAANTSGPSVATGVTVADTFDVALSGCSTASVAAGGATGNDAGPTAGNFSDSGITLPVGGTVTYTSTCTIGAAATGSLANTATIATAVTDANAANNSATDTDTLNVSADLSITKTDGSATEVPGTLVTYTIVAANTSGPSVATGVTVADSFVAALSGCSTTSVAAGGATGHDAGPTAGNINDSGISLPIGGTVTYTSTCSINAAATGTLANTATVSSSGSDGTPGNNSATDTDTLNATADVSITKTDGSATEVPGTTVTYTIVASNSAGPSTATGVTVADTFPGTLSGCTTTSVAAGGATGNDAGPAAGNFSDGGITLPVGASVTYTSTCTISASATGSLANTATVSTTVTDGNAANDSATDTDTLSATADVSITKTDGSATEIPGTSVTYTIVASNVAGPSVATGVTVADSFVAALSGCSTTSVAAGGATGNDAGPTVGNFSDSGITLPVGGTVTYTSTCTIAAAASGTLANTATVSTTATDGNAANDSATDTDTLNATADVSITKTDGSATEIPGTSVTYTIVAANSSGPSVATGVTVADTFPGTLSSCTTTSVVAGGATGNDAGPTAGNFSDSGITLPIGASVTYTATCTIGASATGNLANTATVTTSATDGTPGNNSATDTDTLNATADVSITKTDGAASEVPGTSVTYTIVAANVSGPSVATGVTVADTFVASLSGCSTTSVAAGGATGNDAGPTAGSINDSGITLPVGATVTYTSTCTIAAGTTGNLVNTATVTSAVTDGNAANDSAIDSDTLTATADVSITKTDGSATEVPGTSVTYTIVAANTSGPSVATGVTVADTFVAALSGCSTTSVAAGGATGNDAGPTAGNINDSGITLPVGATVTYTSTCTIAAGTTGNLANTATVATSVTDGTPGNDSATDTDTLAATADVSITKTDASATEVPGTTVTYTIVAANVSGPSVATGVTVADTFVAALSGCSTTSVAAGGATGADAGPTLGNINDSGITLPVGASVTYTSTCTIGATATGNLVNTATVTSAVTDGNAANDSATDTDTLTATADLSITKTDGAASEVPGTTVTYTIVAANTSGPSVATGVTVADTFVAALSGCSTTSVAAGGATGNDAGPTAGNINDGGITLPVGGTVTYTSTCSIGATATGSLVNTATVTGAVTDGNAANDSATDTDTLTATADLSITKTDGAASEVPGTTVSYTIVASNVGGPSVATGVTVADTFVAALSGCSTTSVAAGGATGNDAGPTLGNINDGGITLPVGASVTYTSTCTIGATATGNLVNTATVTGAVTDGNAANDSATDTDTLTATADLSITKTDGSATEIPGTSVTYTIVASNVSGPSAATGVTVADTFVAALSGCSTSSIAAGGATGNDAGPTLGNINDSGITLPVGATVTYTSTCTIGASVTGNLVNTATVSTTVTDGTPGNNSATDTDTLAPSADVAITKTDGSSSQVPGTVVTYTIVASNTSGPSVATAVTVADTFVADLGTCSTTSVAAGGATGNDTGPTLGNINDSGITLPVGASVTYTAVCNLSPTASGSLVNTATVSTAVSDGNAANDSATDTDTLGASADLMITKTDGALTEVPGTTVTYTIVASNPTGPSTATAVSVTDSFVASLSGCSTTSVGAGGAIGFEAGPSAGNINDSGITLPLGASVTYTATCTIHAATTGNLVNSASVASALTDPNPLNNSATDTDTLVPQADLSISKNDFSANALIGGTTSYTIIAFNAGPSAAMSAAISDTAPADCVSFLWTCSGSFGGACTAAGSGGINDTVNLPTAAASVTYIANCQIAPTASGLLVNSASVSHAAIDPVPSDNTATDSDVLVMDAVFKDGFE